MSLSIISEYVLGYVGLFIKIVHIAFASQLSGGRSKAVVRNNSTYGL